MGELYEMKEKFENIFVDCTSDGIKIPKECYLKTGNNIIVDQGQNEIAGWTNEEKGLYKDVPAIIFGDHTRAIKYIDRPFFLGADGVKLLKAKNKNDNYKYLYYALKNAKILDLGYNRHFKLLKEIKIEYPDINIQNNIVEKLDKISSIIHKHKQVINLLDMLVKSQFVEMFENKNFNKIKIKELIDDNIKTAKSSFNKNDYIKYIDISSINNKKNEISGFIEYRFQDAPSRAQQKIEKGDILVSTVRPNLKNIAILKYDDDNLVGSSGYCVLRSKKCTKEYLFYNVLDDRFTDKMVDTATGASYPAIHDEDIYNYEIYDAPIELQNKFADFVKQCDKSKFIIQKSLEKTQMLFESLMQQNFS